MNWIKRVRIAFKIADCYCFHGHDCYHSELFDAYCEALNVDAWGKPL